MTTPQAILCALCGGFVSLMAVIGLSLGIAGALVLATGAGSGFLAGMIVGERL